MVGRRGCVGIVGEVEGAEGVTEVWGTLILGTGGGGYLTEVGDADQVATLKGSSPYLWHFRDPSLSVLKRVFIFSAVRVSVRRVVTRRL